MQTLGYYNGRYGEIEEMSIPMNDRVCWFGDGVYDAGPCRNHKIFALQEHLNRFYRNAELMDLVIPMSKSELAATLCELVQRVDAEEQFVYYQVTRGTAPRNHAYQKGPGNLWIMIKPAKAADIMDPVSLITCEDTRYFHCNIKTLNLLPNVMASQKATEAGCWEAVFYRPGGRITECAHSNVHILKDGVLYTPPADELILPGISRAHLMKACAALGVPVKEIPFYLPDLFDADEIIVTSSSKLCIRADQIDGKTVGLKDSPLFLKLRAYLLEEFKNETQNQTSMADQCI